MEAEAMLQLLSPSTDVSRRQGRPDGTPAELGGGCNWGVSVEWKRGGSRVEYRLLHSI